MHVEKSQPDSSRISLLLSALGAARWIKPIRALIEHFDGLDDYFDSADDIPKRAIAQVLGSLEHPLTDEQIADALSHLDCFTYRVKSPSALWNPLEQSFQEFCAEHNDHVQIFQWDVEYPEPAVIKKWLLGQINTDGCSEIGGRKC